jgi:hypothetical protein
MKTAVGSNFEDTSHVDRVAGAIISNWSVECTPAGLDALYQTNVDYRLRAHSTL